MEKHKTLTEQKHGKSQHHKFKNSEDSASVDTPIMRRKVGRKPKRIRKAMARISPLNLDMSDEKTVLGILNKKLIKVKKLICEACGIVRKSAIGFLSHLHSCGKSPQECLQLRKPCAVCGRMMLSSSLQTHMYTVHKQSKEPLQETVTETTTKRQAAVKAVKLMQHFMDGDSDLSGVSSTNSEFYTKRPVRKLNNRQIGYLKRILRRDGIASCRYPGCKFHTSTMEVLLDHLETCVNKYKQVYACKMCSFHTQEESSILCHIENEHNYTESLDGDSDSSSTSLEEEEEEEEEDLLYGGPGATSKNTLQCEKARAENQVGYGCRKRYNPSNSIRSCLSALKWTLKYQQRHYEQYLFPSLHTKLADWVNLSEEEAQEYLPETKESMLFTLHNPNMMEGNLQNASTMSKKLTLFEGDVLCGNPIFFTGGPVWSVAWCPLPLQWTIETYSKMNQFVAVSCHKNMESTYCMGRSYAHKGLIQIWNLGHLDNKSEGSVPVFGMGIAHEYGTIWCMEWCPSGCYDVQGKDDETLLRIGLLAAACSDGSVRVYSICDPMHLRSLKENYKIFKPQPVVSLVVESNLGAEDQTWQCLCIAWHAGRGHRIIAGGFTNGVIAIWKLDFETPLLVVGEEQSRMILPYKVIPTNIGAVTAIAFSLGQDPRYLLTESVDHTVKLWNLEEGHNPLVLNKKGNVATYNLQLIDWMSGHTCSSLHNFRGFGADVNSIVTRKYTLGALAANPWINAVAEATDAGEFSVVFVHQLRHHTDADRAKKSRRMMISHVGLLELRKYDISDQHSSDLNNSFSQNNNTGLKGNSLDCDHKEEPMGDFFKVTPHENSLMLEGKTGEHTFEIEFILQENNVAFKECLGKDGETHIVINTAKRGENDFDAEAVTNNTHLNLHFQNPESENYNNEGLDANMITKKAEKKDNKENENYDVDTCSNTYNEKEQAEVDRIAHCMTSDSVEQQGLKQSGTDKQVATNKPIKNNLTSHKNTCKVFNTGINTQDAGKKSASTTDLAQQILTSQENKSNNYRLRDAEQLILRGSSELNQLLHSETDGSVKTAVLISDTDISYMQKREPETSSNKQIGESGDFYSGDKPLADTHKLRHSKPEVETYEDFGSNYGVIFCDFPKSNICDPATENRNCTCQSDLLRPADSTAYPILSINRAAWNPNCRSFLWLAAGYQCGFVRTSCVSALHTHMMDDIFRKAAWEISHKEKQKRT